MGTANKGDGDSANWPDVLLIRMWGRSARLPARNVAKANSMEPRQMTHGMHEPLLAGSWLHDGPCSPCGSDADILLRCRA